MNSDFLEKNGVINYISGKEMSFRTQKEGNKVKSYAQDIIKKLKINPYEIYSCRQMHTDNICYASGENGDDYFYGKYFDNTDALITDKKNVGLLIKFADCTPVVLYDKSKKVLSIIHSGWRGTSKKIVEKTLIKMEKDFSCQRESIIGFIGPTIDQENYEVGEEVYDAFKSFKNRDSFFKYRNEKFYLSLISANLDLLTEQGLIRENIKISQKSTFLTESLHSARRDKENYGLNSMFVMMKK